MGAVTRCASSVTSISRPRLEESGGVLGRRGSPEQLRERLPQLRRRVGYEARREEPAEGRIFPAPPEADHLDLQRCFSQLLVAGRPPRSALGVGTEQHEVADPLWVACRVGDRDRTTLGDAKQRKPVETEVVDDGLQVLHPGVQ